VTTAKDGGIPFLNPADPEFSVRSAEVRRARAESWYARTPYGIAVLRYPQMKALLLHPALRQGSHRWPDHNRATGDWAQWWKRIMLNREGTDHARLRRLAQPAFAPRLVSALIPRFQALADELVSGFAGSGRCEFMREFAEPYATRVICALIGLEQERWRDLADLAIEMGRALAVTYKQNEASIDAATRRMFAFSHKVVEERRRVPRDDFIGTLITANADKDALSDQSCTT